MVGITWFWDVLGDRAEKGARDLHLQSRHQRLNGMMISFGRVSRTKGLGRRCIGLAISLAERES
jgi:hypothetical protein